MKVLVTGGTGFIGSHVVASLLEEGHMVRILSRKDTLAEGTAGKAAELWRGDLEDTRSVISAMEGMEVLYHVGEIKNTNRAASARNIKLFEDMLKNVTGTGVTRLVFVSALTVAGIPSAVPADEETKPEYVLSDHYTAYKRRCEELLAENRSDVEYAIVRPAPVYGPGSRYLGRFLRTIKSIGPIGLPFVGDGTNNAPLVYVKDLARAISLCGSEGPAAGQTFNITDGLRHSWLDFFRAAAHCMGQKLRIVPIPPLLLKIPAFPADLFAGIFGMDLDPVRYVSYFSKDLFFANGKAEKLLGWKAHYSLEDGMRETAKSYGLFEAAS